MNIMAKMKEYMMISKTVCAEHTVDAEFLRYIYRMSRKRYFSYHKNTGGSGRLIFMLDGIIIWRPSQSKHRYKNFNNYAEETDSRKPILKHDTIFVFSTSEKVPEQPYNIDVGYFCEIKTDGGKWRYE